mmetsp:Transcript_19896/g.64050  ORF Transcript_19896/g.64050 Transcript_19896/m.64050 type:complete len:264 (+) Transcript_19896:1089-1880(+)
MPSSRSGILNARDVVTSFTPADADRASRFARPPAALADLSPRVCIRLLCRACIVAAPLLLVGSSSNVSSKVSSPLPPPLRAVVSPFARLCCCEEGEGATEGASASAEVAGTGAFFSNMWPRVPWRRTGGLMTWVARKSLSASLASRWATSLKPPTTEDVASARSVCFWEEPWSPLYLAALAAASSASSATALAFAWARRTAAAALLIAFIFQSAPPWAPCFWPDVALRFLTACRVSARALATSWAAALARSRRRTPSSESGIM